MRSVQPAMRRLGSFLILLCGALSLVGCGKETAGDDGADGDETTGTSGITVSASSPMSNTASETNETGTMSASVGTEEADASMTATESDSDSIDTGGSSGTTGNDPDNPVDCGGHVYTCGDGMDNDEDGLIDLMDPECTGPCDDDESSYQTGIPGDNMDCKQDCFFDGNSGQGDDGCIWDLKCDPANPGEFIGCEYSGGNNCENMPPNQSEDCIMFCEQYVPPGCDCFGCCTVCGDEGCVDIFLNGDPECNIDNLEACTMCTSQIEDCGNPCVPEECEICFGETEPPEGCGENECLSDLPCMDNPDCPTDYFCYLGCCYPPPPG
jgi:hypothetical protein